MTAERRRLRVRGTVQGVGFRPFVYRQAVALKLAGHVSNDDSGVVIEIEGATAALDELTRRLTECAPPLAQVVEITSRSATPVGEHGFRILPSQSDDDPDVRVATDIATCAACLSELFDPQDRRFRYPFINCTNCGPRYTIVLSVPYDRENTTMASFEMCGRCRAEYEDPGDRRFHAEPIACPACGPKLRVIRPNGDEVAAGTDAIATAARVIAEGKTVAVKGLGGYHLACDATNETAVAELRRRKERDDKPFAVMAADVETAQELCHLAPRAEAALLSARAPIVLVPRREPSAIAASVAPGLPELGLLLPYTPVHHLLVRELDVPIVLTSGNISDEPIVHDDREALTRLGPIADALLVHDRDIHIRCDDSVVRCRERPQLLRRSRGFAPETIELPHASAVPILALGAELKNTVAVVKGRNLTVSHHIGDLEHLPAYRSFLQAVDHLCGLARVTPSAVAHDLHPEYLSTKFAFELDLPLVPVQHHHAHIASCLVDHGRTGPVIGVAFDGLGFGPDGTLWGGEFLLADLSGYTRLGHLRPVALPGGASAIREPWRMAAAWLSAVRGVDDAQLHPFGDSRWRAVVHVANSGTAPITTSVGRLFDAVAALAGIRSSVSYEGQAAVELEAAAASVAPGAAGRYPFTQETAEGRTVLDPGACFDAVLTDVGRGRAPESISAAFHDGFGFAAADVAARLAGEQGVATVALSGGVFQNERLTKGVTDRLREHHLEVLQHERIPPNDGGISVGQAAVAAYMHGAPTA